MTWRVHIIPDLFADGIALQVGRRVEGSNLVQVVTYTSTSEAIDTTVAPAGVPSLRLEDGLARALLDALAEHYGGTTSGRQQRADYEHERRERVKLTDALIRVAAPGVGRD